MATEQVASAAPALRKSRYYSAETVAWAQEANGVLRSHGVVCGTQVYANRYRARWRVRHLIDVLCNLALAQRWELREHVEARHGGYMWTLEYVEDR